jgi:transposase
MQAYSIDLRKKVIKFIEEGNSQQSATKIYSLNKATVNRWWQRYKKEGHVNPRVNLGRKPKIDRAELKKYVDAHPDSRLYDISLKFMVSVNAIHRWLKKLGYSYKKKPSPMWKQAKKKEPHTKKQ